MPAAKLTLRLDAATVERAKRYARRRGTSVSRLVEAYFTALDAPVSNLPDWAKDMPPIVQAFLDRPPAPDVSEADYDRYRDEKYGGAG